MRWQIRAPRSWPIIMIGRGNGDEGMREFRVERRAWAWLVLLCGVESGEERP